MRDRSTAASVCPDRTSTPPLRARSGNTWTGARQIARRAGGVERHPHGFGAVGGEMPVVVRSRASIDTHIAVSRRDELSLTSSGISSWSSRSGRHRQADQPAAVTRHEVDRLRRDLRGGHRQVALVLAILVVDDHDHPAGLKASIA
jgi:hypothetical protein